MEASRYHKADKIGGRYLVHQALRGGMGEVYLCLDLAELIPYALKTFQNRFLTNPTARDLFKQEVSYWVALENHPHIVRCFHMETLANQPFMFLEWVAGDESHGTDLRSWLRRGPLSSPLALQFALDICSGLSHAQFKQPGMVHCDLKPDNILVAQGEIAKIIDWGLATLAEQAGLDLLGSGTFETGGRQSLMRVGKGAGTPPYMAPEQWRGETLDVRTDLYAVGCILYELVSGRWPYEATTSEDFEQAHLSAPIPALSASLPLSLSEVVVRCLAKDPSERYGSAEELGRMLRGVLVEELREAVRVLPVGDTFDAGDYNNRGVTYANLGQNERALQDYDCAIALEHDNATAYNNRGLSYLNLRQSKRALYDFDRAIVLQPDLARAHTGRGNAYAELGQYATALEDYDRSLALEADDAITYYNRGNAYRNLGQSERALQNYDRALALQPDFAEAYNNRGLSYLNLGQSERALYDFDRAIALNPDDAIAYTNRGNAYDNLSQPERALQDFDRALALQPDYADAYYNRGGAYFNLGQHEQAIQDYDHAIALKSDYAGAYTNRGLSYFHLGQYIRALQDYDRAIALQPDFAMAYVNKGAALANDGALSEALVCFEAAERLGETIGTQRATLVRQMLRQSGASEDPAQQAFEAFQQTDNLAEMRVAVLRWSFMTGSNFISAIQQAILTQVPPQQRSAFQQRLDWLRQIAGE